MLPHTLYVTFQGQGGVKTCLSESGDVFGVHVRSDDWIRYPRAIDNVLVCAAAGTILGIPNDIVSLLTAEKRLANQARYRTVSGTFNT